MAHRFFPRKTGTPLIFLTILALLGLTRCGVKLPPRASGYQDGPLSDLEPSDTPDTTEKTEAQPNKGP